MGTILLENTLMPLFLPFLSQLKSDDSIELDIILRICIGHFRGKAELRQSNMKLCVSCLIDDATFGSPYWHRSHQLKGVGVCYRHGHVLISECSNCNEPFRMRHGLLGVPWVACKCGVGIKDTPQLKVAASIEEQEFALFAHKQLNGNSVAMSSIVLGGIFSQEIQDQVRKRHRPMINRKMLVDTLIARLDNEFLPYVDIAYAAGFLISNVRLLDADIANEPEEEN